MLDTHEVVLAEGDETCLLEDCNYEGFTNFVEFARLYPADHSYAMTPFAPIVGYGGREHLKALLRLASGRSFEPFRSSTPTSDLPPVERSSAKCDCESTPAGRPSWRGARWAPEHAHESLVSSGARSYGTPLSPMSSADY